MQLQSIRTCVSELLQLDARDTHLFQVHNRLGAFDAGNKLERVSCI